MNTKITNVKNAKFVSLEAHNLQEYLMNDLLNDMRDFQESGTIKTGYSNIDAITNLYPGLYAIGAISSLGKTTFIHQMADQLAAAGENVLYFSYEQSTLELVSKSLSRIMAQNDFTSAMTSLQIRKTRDVSNISDAIQIYNTYSKNMTIVECDFSATIDDIVTYVNNYITQKQVKPVVIIDYLQVISNDNTKHSTKEAVDTNVKRLKQLQEDHKIAVLVISSVNRQNYLTQIDYESFKESGGIEYTADVVWGLQLAVLHDEIFDKQSKLNEKRKKVRDAKAEEPRRIEVCCLKNRFGISSYSCMFNYYPQFDYFVPDMDITD